MNSQEHIVRSIGGDTLVEVVDLVNVAESEHEQPYPQEKKYAKVDILESGWIRCADRADDRHPDNQGISVDYYPPERVNGIYSVEQEEDVDE